MNKADLKKIKELLETVTAYQISKGTGIGGTTISRWVTGKTPLEKMSLENAIKLTEFKKKIDKESENMKPVKIVDVYGRELEVDENSKKLLIFSNKNREIHYNARIIENGVLTDFWTEYVVEGTIDDITEKLEAFGNPVKHRYAIDVAFDSSKNDPEGKLWSQYVKHVEENESKYFNKKGDWKEYIYNGELHIEK